MRLFKFLVFSFALYLGFTIGFCGHSDYELDPYNYVQTNYKPVKASVKIEFSEEIKKGKKLFKANCAACHNKNMIDDMSGPALAGVRERWEGREDLLYDWIRNSQKVIASGDEYATKLYRDWDGMVMNAFPNFEEEDITAILEYVEAVN